MNKKIKLEIDETVGQANREKNKKEKDWLRSRERGRECGKVSDISNTQNMTIEIQIFRMLLKYTCRTLNEQEIHDQYLLRRSRARKDASL